MLGPEERSTLLTQFNPRPAPAPDWPTVCQAITDQAAQQPDHPAVVAENASLTYHELESLANRAAHSILASSNSPGNWDRQPGQPGQPGKPIVAVMADRTTWPVVGMLAALKAGAAYVGLDLEREGGERLQVFSGDVSRPDLGLDPQRHTALESDKVNQAERLFVAV